MDRPAPCLRLEAITPPRQEIMRIWRTFHPMDRAFIQGIIGDVVMFTETPVDWIFLRTAIEFWDPGHTVFNFRGTELAPTIEEHTALIQRPTPTTQGIFVPNPFAHTWPSSIHRDRRRRNGPRPPRLPELHLPPLPKPKAPPKRLCTQSYGPSRRNEIGSVASLLTLARRKIATGVAPYLNRQRLRMAEEDRVDISEEVNPPVPVHSQPPPTHAPPPPTLAGILSAYLGAPPTHLPPPTSSGAPLPQVSLTSSASDDQTRITALEGTVNQLAASMAANMAELLALLRGSNRASSSSTPPPGQGPTVDPIPWAAFLTSDQVLSAPPPISLPAPAAAYTIPPPTIFPAPSAPAPTRPQVADLPSYPPLQLHINFSYQARPPINTTFLEPGTPTHAAQLPPKFKIPEFKTYKARRIRDTTSAIAEGRCYSIGGEGSSKKVPATSSSSSGRRGKEVSVNAVNPAHPTSQQYSVNLTTAPTAAPAYFPSPPQHQPQSIYYSAPPVPPPMTSQPYVHHYAPASTPPLQPKPPVSRDPPPAQQNPTSQGPQADGTQHRPRKQYTPLPAPLSHIYRQLLASDQIRPISPGPNFDPSVQDQSKSCEYHQSEPGHTLDNCWRLRDKIQKRIDSNRLTFNAVRSPNVQANPLPDHGPGSGPSINMITICTSGRDEDAQDNPLPFMNVDLNRVRQSKTAVRAFDGSRREVNGEIDLLIDVGPCSFIIMFQVLDIPNAFSLLLGRPWIHSASAIPSYLHQRLKFIVEEKLITVKGEEDYAIYKETAIGPSRTDRMIGKVLLRNNYIPGTGLGAREQGISRPIKIEEYKHRRGLGFRPSCHEIVEARRGNHLRRFAARYGRLNRGIPSLRRLEDHQITSVEPTKEINVGTKEEPRTLKIGTALDPAQRAWMIDFLKEYQEVFAWSYADMPGLDPSIVEHFLPLDIEKFPPKR
ncbi:hypothetical protein CRG98_013006 [Punica granatum]|uniref:G-patch domain-containing protein n=1 Tax=Punica granatum TaxID=22663 RepID=A0A2I0KDL1_PUNGR|nr:hypothetical protein CRG98_013006 [Punica granatum]